MAVDNNNKITQEDRDLRREYLSRFTVDELETLHDLVKEKPKIDKMLEDEQRAQLFWSTIRIWSGWIAAAIVSLWSVYEVIMKIFKSKGLS